MSSLVRITDKVLSLSEIASKSLQNPDVDCVGRDVKDVRSRHVPVESSAQPALGRWAGKIKTHPGTGFARNRPYPLRPILMQLSLW